MTARSAAFVLALVLLGPSTGTADTYPRQPGIDVTRYVFRLALSDTSDEIVAGTTVEFMVTSAKVGELALDLASKTPEREGRGMHVTGVLLDGQPARFTHENDRLLIALANAAAVPRRAVAAIEYRGIPATGLIIGNNKHGERTFFSNNWPTKAREWLPVIDHPYEKAAGEFVVSAPAHYQVVSNGLLTEETDLPGSMRLTRWTHSVPIPVWLYTLGVARFAVQHLGTFAGRPVQTWVYHQDRDAGFFDFSGPTLDALAFFDRRIGPFPYEKLANVQSNSVRGAMESATAIFYDDDAVTGTRDRRWRNTVVHEIAHQWFGNSVTERDWDDVWLSEGFATYFTLLFIEHRYGHDEFVEGLRRSRDEVREFEAGQPGYRIVHDNLSDMRQVLSRQIYQKGAWVLHMLRGLIGDEAFWTGISDYYRRFRDAHASSDDFRLVMEAAAGRELGWFFDQWLRRGGWLTVEGTWTYERARQTVVVTLSQKSTIGATFRLPIQVALHDDGGTARVVSLDLAEPTGVFTIPAPAEPKRVELDPGTFVLMDSSFSRR